jgi:rare lipoprotein A
MRIRVSMRAKRLAMLLAAMSCLAEVGFAREARAAPADYGYGKEASPPAGEPLDLRPVLAPVRKIAPETLSARAEQRPVRAPAPRPAAEATAPAASPPASDAALVSAPLDPKARPEWLEQERVGAPYEAKGKWYVPTPDPGYAETGFAVSFAPRTAGVATASGEPYAPDAILAAHPTLPLPSLVQVTNLETGRELIVRLVDRGPFDGRGLIALSDPALAALGAGAGGQAVRVHVRYLGPAPRRVAADSRDVARIASPSAPAAIAAAPRPPQTDLERFVVQVGAFGTSAAAERVRRTVAALGPSATDARNGLHRVRLGPVATRADAERLRKSVVALGFSSALVAPLR